MKGDLVASILNALTEHGPMTRADLCEEIGRPHGTVSGTLTRLVREQRVHIAKWHLGELNGMLSRPRAMYAAGPGKPAPMPRRKPSAEVSREYQARKRRTVASVWDLALSGRERIARTRA